MTCVHFDQAQIRPQAAAASFHHLRHFHHFATSYFSVLLCFGHEGGGMLVRGCQSGERVITTARQRWTPEGRTARGRPKTIWRRALEKGWDKAGWTGGGGGMQPRQRCRTRRVGHAAQRHLAPGAVRIKLGKVRNIKTKQ